MSKIWETATIVKNGVTYFLKDQKARELIAQCYSPSNPPPYPVTSVNGKTGGVSLTASDVGAIPTAGGEYTGPLTRALTALNAGTLYALSRWQDPDGNTRGGLYIYRSSSYGDAVRLYHTKNVGGSEITNGFSLYISDTGTPTVVFGYPGAWRDGLNVAAKYSAGDTVSFPSTGNSYYQRFHGDWRYSYALYFFVPLARSCEGLTATASGTVYVITNNTRTSVSLSTIATVDAFCAPGGVAVRLNWGSGNAPSLGQSQYDIASVQPYGFTITFS